MDRKRKKILSQGLFLVFSELLITGWLAAQAEKTVDFSQLVIVGDSLAAGVQNGSLEGSQQQHGFASVIAGQISTPHRAAAGSSSRRAKHSGTGQRRISAGDPAGSGNSA
jgi:hypothetical protein